VVSLSGRTWWGQGDFVKVVAVEPGGYLYAVEDVFSAEILRKIYGTDWNNLNYVRLDIGRNRRRLINCLELDYESEITALIKTQWMPYFEKHCGIKFKNNSNLFNINWWVDEPGFKPAMHTDGDKPSAIQIYLLPVDATNLGTTFFNSNNELDVLHRFCSTPNTGYLMFNQHQYLGSRKLLWHDMEQAVPESVMRLCFYVSLPEYELVEVGS
jgi:hypothetical protein